MAFEFKEERLASNPVALVQARGLSTSGERRVVAQLVERGVALPDFYLRHLGLPAGAPRRHGVVGCVVDAHGIGWVDRLRASPSRTWQSRTGLPFEALELEEILLALLQARGEDLVHVLPETRAFALHDELTTPIAGESMTMAAALAVIDATLQPSVPELGAVLCLVQRQGATDLVPVEMAQAKWAAFQRECGRGTLCVIAPGAGADALESSDEARTDGQEWRAQLAASFDEVWVVSSLSELGQQLHARGWLDELARLEPLTRAALDNVEGLMKRLLRNDWFVGRALGLAKRLHAAAEDVGFAVEVPMSRRRAVERARFAPLRLSASLETVVRDAEAHVAALLTPLDATHEERAWALLDLAAAQQIAYRFDAMLDCMRELVARIETDPLAYSAPLRVRVWSLYGQALAKRVGDAAAWRAAFGHARALVALAAPGEAPLARGFWIAALLMDNALDEAAQQLEEARAELGRNLIARAFWAFNRADLARRRGEVWSDPELDGLESLRAGGFWRPVGYYFVATARKPGRAAADRVARFERAADAFGAGIENADSGLHVFVQLMRLGAARDDAAWGAARAGLLAFVQAPFAAGIAEWFGARLDALPTMLPPDHPATLAPALEAIWDHDPYLLGRSHESEWGT